MSNFLAVGDQVVAMCQNTRTICTVKYVGNVNFEPGEWIGLELPLPMGKHNGKVNGDQYFTTPPFRAVFVKPGAIEGIVEVEPRTVPVPTLNYNTMNSVGLPRSSLNLAQYAIDVPSVQRGLSRPASIARAEVLSQEIAEFRGREPFVRQSSATSEHVGSNVSLHSTDFVSGSARNPSRLSPRLRSRSITNSDLLFESFAKPSAISNLNLNMSSMSISGRTIGVTRELYQNPALSRLSSTEFQAKMPDNCDAKYSQTNTVNIDIRKPSSVSALPERPAHGILVPPTCIRPTATTQSRPTAALVSDVTNSRLIRSPQHRGVLLKSASRAADAGFVATVWSSGVRGLANLGNTCYLNSMLQILMQIEPLRSAILPACSSDTTTTSKSNTFLSCLRNLMMAVWIPEVGAATVSSAPLRPTDLVTCLAAKYRRFRGRLQQDAVELLRILLSELHEETVEACSNTSSRSGSAESSSLISKIFRGRFASVVRCDACGRESMQQETFFDVSLAIPNSLLKTPVAPSKTSSNNLRTASSAVGSVVRASASVIPVVDNASLETCLKYFTISEKLSGYRCETCFAATGQATVACKRVLISEAPPMLVLHIKRFSHSNAGMKKIDLFLKFHEIFDISAFCTNAAAASKDSGSNFGFSGFSDNERQAMHQSKNGQQPILYSLHGIVVHGGGSAGGHYTTYVRIATPPIQSSSNLIINNENISCSSATLLSSPEVILTSDIPSPGWFYFTDTRIRTCTLEEVLGRTPYVLFYRRLS